MNIRSFLSEFRLLIFIKLIPDMISEYWRFSGGNVRCRMSKDPDKLLTDILMTTHALEKGLSIFEKKKGFGIAKMQTLLSNIKKYIVKYGYNKELNTPLSVLRTLIEYHISQGYTDSRLDSLRDNLEKLISSIGMQSTDFTQAGAVRITGEQMQKLQFAKFEDLCNNRYSLRHFGKAPIPFELLNHSIDVAKKTPSACNRQAYRVHVFEGNLKDEILLLQGGANSFYKEVDKAILITGNLKRYYTMEQHLAYVDASLFAMSLMYSLTANGIASIPLTMGRYRKTLNKLYSTFQIPENEVPVILIAIGSLPKETDVCMSYRNPVESFTTYHK